MISEKVMTYSQPTQAQQTDLQSFQWLDSYMIINIIEYLW